MLTYIVYYAFSSSLLCLSFAKSRLISRLLFFLFFLTLALFSGLRGTVGQDTYNYQLLYEMFGRDGFLSILSSLSSEPLFVFLSVLHYSIFESFFLFVLFISFLQVILLAYATKGLYYRRMFLSRLIHEAGLKMKIADGILLKIQCVPSRTRTKRAIRYG